MTTNAGYTGPGLNLSAFANGNYNFTFGPIQVDGYTFTAAPGGGGNSGNGSVVGQGGYGLNSNGSFGGAAVYIGVDSGTGYAQLIRNAGPVKEIGFFMNYAPRVGDPATISALDVNGNVFASYDLTTLAPISTPGGFNAFVFRGFRNLTQPDWMCWRVGALNNMNQKKGIFRQKSIRQGPIPARWALCVSSLTAAV
jgi:hypothetical protein